MKKSNNSPKTSAKKSPSKPARENPASQSPKINVEEKNKFFVVGIGASAGGLEALEAFFRHMSNDGGMAFVVVPHLEPTHTTLLPQLLQNSTKMKVSQISDKSPVAPNCVYIIPPNKDLSIRDGILRLVQRESITAPRAPINFFFRSLAADQGERAVAIILSGMGSDGTEGIKDIKAELGMILVQDPKTSKFDSMPQSAIDTGLADYVESPEKMPEVLSRHARHFSPRPIIPAPETDQERSVAEALNTIFATLKQHTGHDFTNYKRSTIGRRIARRMNANKLEDLHQYARFISENKREAGLLFKELLIGVTNFFRDPESFEMLKSKALPALLADKPDNAAIRIWVSGCSTGEEAYSLAILFKEYMEEHKRNFHIQIFATDIDPSGIDKARMGIFPGSISYDVNEERLKRFFQQEGGGYRIRRELRETVIFATQNIIKDPPFTKMDMISCRNLLIYLDSELQQKLLPLFHYCLKPGGILFLGPSETIGRFGYMFTALDKKWKIYTRSDSGIGNDLFMDLRLGALTPPRGEKPLHAADQHSERVEKILLENFVPATVICNDRGEIIYIHGRTGKYLEPAPGRPELNIVEMAREGLRTQLATGLRRAVNQNCEVISAGLKVKTDGGFEAITLKIKPVGGPDASQNLFMVTFEAARPKAEKEPVSKSTGGRERNTQNSPELETELHYVKESLQSTVEELETSNEELKSTMEEYQSTNEELQSTNEELETSKEEMQSLNEELITVNAELREKIEEVSKAYENTRNFIDNIDLPTIFLDSELRVRFFSSQAGKIVNLIQSDIGRPLAHLVTNLVNDTLMQNARHVIKTLRYVENEVQTHDDRWYFMRIMPYKTVENKIDGVVMSFMDISEQKIMRQELQQVRNALEYSQALVNTINLPLLVLDKNLRVVSANNAFYRMFHVSPRETEGRVVFDLGNRQWNIPELRELIDEILPLEKQMEDFPVEHEFPDLGLRRMRLNARWIAGRDDGSQFLLLAIEDVTSKPQGGSNTASTQRKENS